MKPARIFFTKRGAKDETRCPKHVKEALQDWIVAVETIGLNDVRKIWRAIYTESETAVLVIIRIEEVIPHAY